MRLLLINTEKGLEKINTVDENYWIFFDEIQNCLLEYAVKAQVKNQRAEIYYRKGTQFGSLIEYAVEKLVDEKVVGPMVFGLFDWSRVQEDQLDALRIFGSKSYLQNQSRRNNKEFNGILELAFTLVNTYHISQKEVVFYEDQYLARLRSIPNFAEIKR